MDIELPERWYLMSDEELRAWKVQRAKEKGEPAPLTNESKLGQEIAEIRENVLRNVIIGEQGRTMMGCYTIYFCAMDNVVARMGVLDAAASVDEAIKRIVMQWPEEEDVEQLRKQLYCIAEDGTDKIMATAMCGPDKVLIVTTYDGQIKTYRARYDPKEDIIIKTQYESATTTINAPPQLHNQSPIMKLD